MADFPVTVETRGPAAQPPQQPAYSGDLDAVRSNARVRILAFAAKDCRQHGPATQARILDRAMTLIGSPDCYNSQQLYRYGQKSDELRQELAKLFEQGEKEGWL